MKRFIAAVSFSVIAVPAFAGGLPYEQNLVDRALPNIEPRRTRVAEFKGDTRSDVEIASESAAKETVESPWANDHNFIAPAQ
jgi:hypothetical protein